MEKLAYAGFKDNLSAYGGRLGLKQALRCNGLSPGSGAVLPGIAGVRAKLWFKV